MSAFKRSEQGRSEALPAPSAGRPSGSGDVATVGPSVTIEGDLKGEEDLLIEGKILGRILVPSHAVRIGESGRVKAEVRARSICVEGEVEGDLMGLEDVVVRASGTVLGSIVSPRVTLESGCRFKGTIDMEKERAGRKSEEPGPEDGAPLAT